MESIQQITIHHPGMHNEHLDGMTIYFRGYFYVNNAFVDSSSIASLVSDQGYSKDFVKQWNGEFFCIVETPEKTTIISDRKRTIPLFYRNISNGKWEITDHIAVSTEHSQHIQPERVAEFIQTGMIIGPDTLIPEWSQTTAGEYLILSKDVSRASYFTYQESDELFETIDSAKEEFKKTIFSIFDHVAKRIGNRKILLPLSGGYDSRLIAVMLHQAGLADQVFSFTYGRPDNQEAIISKEIAQRLGFQWTCFHYDKKMWRNLATSSSWNDFMEFASNYSHTPHLQDFPAIEKIAQDKNLLDGVFMPGHSLDFLAGSHLPYEALYGETFDSLDILHTIKNKHYRLWIPDNQGELVQSVDKRLSRSLDSKKINSSAERTYATESWNLEERQSKFIIHSVRSYEYFDFEWTLPLWDDRLIEFFERVPLKWKYKKFLYNSALHDMFPEFFGKPTEAIAPSLKNKYGKLYPVLKKAYGKQKLLKEYYANPMEWYGILPSYFDYLLQLSFYYKDEKYSTPYNINSFIVKNLLKKLGVLK